MLLYQYLDALPPIPAHLTKNPEIPDESKIGFRDGIYARWAPRPELKEWLSNNVSTDVTLAGVQTIEGDVPLHCDKRKWALNYILDTGGSSVVTGFYKLPKESTLQPPAARAKFANDAEELATVVFVPGRWHLLNTHILHSVSGVIGKRVAVTIGLNSVNPFDEIKGYTGLLDF